MTRQPSLLLAFSLLPLAIAPPVLAQETFERTPNLSGGWVGYTGFVYLNVPYRFVLDAPGPGLVAGQPTFEGTFSLPWHALAGARFAYGSPTVPGRPDEWEAFARIRPLGEAHGAPFDLALTAAYNGAAESLDAELTVARWLGPLRVIGAARGMTSGYGTGDARLAVGGGATLFPLPGHWPLALAGDVMTLIDQRGDERLAWSAGLQLGLNYSTHTLSLFATNTLTSTLQGASVGDGQVRFGVELTIPLPVGRLLGMYVPREQAMEAVVEDPEVVEQVVTVEIRDYLFLPKRLEIEAGTTIEWVNRDHDVHTVDADDRAWRSGAIQHGERWRARFDGPGTYAYHCGPHPFMRGIVVVR